MPAPPSPNKVVCVGRNYLLHCQELSNDLPVEPLLFLKPSSSISWLAEGEQTGRAGSLVVRILEPCSAGEEGGEVASGTSSGIDHEIELAVVIGKPLRFATKEEAMAGIAGYRLALDLTDRKAQDMEKKGGMPWTKSKCRDGFLPLTEKMFLPAELNLEDTELLLSVNGKERQKGNTKNMIFRVPELLSYISTVMTLEKDDIILTGTPHGVGLLSHGDDVTIRCLSAGSDYSVSMKVELFRVKIRDGVFCGF